MRRTAAGADVHCEVGGARGARRMARGRHGGTSSSHRARDAAQWSQRRLAGLAIRGATVLLPSVAAVVCIVGLGLIYPRRDGSARMGWYAGICIAGWLVSWALHRLLERLL